MAPSSASAWCTTRTRARPRPHTCVRTCWGFTCRWSPCILLALPQHVACLRCSPASAALTPPAGGADKPKGYAFIEYEHKNDMKSAYKAGDGKKVEGRRISVDVERGRTVPGW